MKSNSFSKRRWISFIISYIFNFLGGTEFAIILPTAWLYIQSIGYDDVSLLGIVLSAMSIAATFSHLIAGFLVDRFNKPKEIVLFLNVFQIVGNFLYFVGGSIWTLVLGRVLVGFGSGTATVMFAEMARATNMAEKTRVMTVAFACRQVSILLGPAYNLALRNLDFQLGPFLVNEESSPGLLLAILWIIMEFIVWMFYGHPSKEFEEEQQQLSKRDLGQAEASEQILEKNEEEEYHEENPLTRIREIYFQVIQTPHLVTLFFAQFVAFFTLCFIEGALPPTFQYFFGFGSYEVSLLFLVMGAEAIMVYIIAWLLASRVSDRTFLSCGMTAVFASLIALLVYDCLAMTPGGSGSVVFVILCGILFFGVPLTSVGTLGLISKQVHHHAQGFGQGFRRFVTSVGVTLGPLWAGGMFYNRVVFYLVPIFIMALALLLCALSYREFAPRQPPQTRNVPDLSPKECTQALTSSNTPK